MLYNRQGKNQLAEKLLKEVVAAYPDQYDVMYSLGLLQAEMKNFEQAAIYLREAAKGLPDRARIRYNLGILLQRIDNDNEAESALQGALAIEPGNPEYLYAMAVFYLQRQRLDEAKFIAEQMMKAPGTRSAGQQLLETIQLHGRAKGNGQP